jgi:phage shock protein E
MNSAWFVLGVMLVLWVAFTRLGKIDGERARSLVSAGAKLIDVRTPAEFAAGHIEGARNIPLDAIPSHAAAIAAEQRPVVVYCASGMRSATAKRVLKASGVREVHDLGSMARW